MLVCLKVSPKENHCMVCFARRLSNLHVPQFFWLKPKCSTNCPGKGFVRKWSIPPELPISQENDDNPSESLELGLPFYPIYIYPHLNSMCFNHEIPYFSYSVHKSQYIPYVYEKSHMNPSISQYIPYIPYPWYPSISMEISIFSPLSSVKSPLQQLICAPRAAPAPRRSEGLRHSWPRHRAPGKKWVVCAYNMCVHIYICYCVFIDLFM